MSKKDKQVPLPKVNPFQVFKSQFQGLGLVCAGDAISHIIEEVEFRLLLKQIDQKRIPHATRSTISTCLANTLLERMKPDSKFDDRVIQDEDDFEPIAPPLDNCAKNNKVQKIQIVQKGGETLSLLKETKSKISLKTKSIFNDNDSIGKPERKQVSC